MSVALSLLTAAVLAGATNNNTSKNTCSVDHLNPATLIHLQMGKVSERLGDKPMLATSELTTTNGGKILGYTRIGVRYTACGGLRDLLQERRGDLKRYFFGKQANKILTLKLNISPLGGVDATKPLASIKRNSNKKGESWDTVIVNDEILLPYFRVDRSSTVSIEASLRSDRTYESGLAGSTLEVVQKAAALINPATTLITKENKERFNSAASFVDGAVNGMLAVSIDEKANSRVALDSPEDKQSLAIITLSLPMANRTFASTLFPLEQGGQWEVYAERYRPSMMADLQSATAISRKDTSVTTVMNYLVGDKKTVRESLAASKSLAAARDSLVAAKDGDISNKARILCRAIASEVEVLGLTPVDVGAVAWAYLADLSFVPEKYKAAEVGCADVEQYPAP